LPIYARGQGPSIEWTIVGLGDAVLGIDSDQARMRQFRYWSVKWHSRPNFRRLGNSGGNSGQVKRTMTTVLPRGTLERADQVALSPLGAGQCNLAWTVANQSVRVEDFRDTVLWPRKGCQRNERGAQ
jgi:hypothetical protein